MSINQVVTAGIEETLNRLLALDPASLAQLAQLEGRVIGLEFTGLPFKLFLFPGEEGFMVFSEFDGEPDTNISGTPLAFTHLALGKDSSDVLFGGEIRIDGDTALGNRVKRILQQVDIDWEEQLSRVTGDLVAHQVGRLFRHAGEWWRDSNDAISRDLGEYLQEETRLLPARAEVQQFIHQVDEARLAMDRLEARLRLLKEKQREENNA